MKLPPPEKDHGSPSKDTSGRHAGDQWIRKHGFAIRARPWGKPALWVRRGEVYTEAEVLRIIEREKRAA